MRLCSGCQAKVPDTVRFCDECQLERDAPKPDGIREHVGASDVSYDERLDKLRKSGRYERVRDIAIKRCPFCARCGARLSEIVDHIVPAWVVIVQARESGLYPFDPWAGFYLLSNLQGLCRPCHGEKTAEDKAHVGPWPNAVHTEQVSPKKVWSF